MGHEPAEEQVPEVHNREVVPLTPPPPFIIGEWLNFRGNMSRQTARVTDTKKVSGELFSLTYGALVAQILKVTVSVIYIVLWKKDVRFALFLWSLVYFREVLPIKTAFFVILCVKILINGLNWLFCRTLSNWSFKEKNRILSCHFYTCQILD